MTDVRNLVFGPQYGTCFNCHAWLDQHDSLGTCSKCRDEMNEALKGLKWQQAKEEM